MKRDDDELLELQANRRPGRPTSTREDRLRQRIEAEESEYNTGFWVPDMRDAESKTSLRQWSGDWSSLSSLRFIRMTKKGEIRISSFPPKGLS